MVMCEGDKKADDSGIPSEMRQLLNAFADAVERAKARKWGANWPGKSHQEALEKVRTTLKSQLTDRNTSNLPGALFLRGAIAIELVFDPLPPEEETLHLAVQHGLDDYETFTALRMLAALGYYQRSPALRHFQRGFLLGLIREPKNPPGPSRIRDLHRNMVIASQIEQLKKIGIRPTRNKATVAKKSGCDLVADALADLGYNLDSSAVERIWKLRDQRPQPHFLAELLSDALSNLLTHEEWSDEFVEN